MNIREPHEKSWIVLNAELKRLHKLVELYGGQGNTETYNWAKGQIEKLNACFQPVIYLDRNDPVIKKSWF